MVVPEDYFQVKYPSKGVLFYSLLNMWDFAKYFTFLSITSNTKTQGSRVVDGVHMQTHSCFKVKRGNLSLIIHRI